MDILLISKILSFVIVIVVGGIGVCIPIYIGYLNPTLLQYINVFAGGTLLTLALCHLLPEAEAVVKLNNLKLKLIGVEVPIVAYLTLIGLTIILFFEKALFSPQEVDQFHMHDHSFPHKRDHHHHHHKDPGCVGIAKDSIINVNSRLLISDNDNDNSIGGNFNINGTNENLIDDNNLSIDSIKSQSCDIEKSHAHQIILENNESNKNGIVKPLIKSSSFSSSSSSHRHSRSVYNSSNSSSNVYFLVSALSVHSIFEGMLVGISKNYISVITITLVIIAHKWVEGIAVSAGIKKHSEISANVTKQLLTSFIFMSPLGIILGQLFWFISSPYVNVIFTCISAGALLYVALGEMILDEFNCGENRKQKFLLFILGIILVTIINLIQHRLGGCSLHTQEHNHHHHHHHCN
ncbi:zinc ZIP transporter protein [Cryptosporidium ryanae]|uniref:zinc ZIP transporter protein n=1 Tax=Cryptosporidium ryanae TaxID=515981 RepID=UPI003519DCE6|nr:zinc ZIP transporter protein [Cryptosporidium ryanae]